MDHQDIKTDTTKPTRRLCSEIQLFDLCDLESCNHKADRFCTNTERLSIFEQIAENDVSSPAEQYLVEGYEESEEDCELGCDAGFLEDDYDDKGDWEE